MVMLQSSGCSKKYLHSSGLEGLQSTLIIGMGCLGIRRVSSLALSAFLASAAGTLALLSSFRLPSSCLKMHDIIIQLEGNLDQYVEDFASRWRAESKMNEFDSFLTHIKSKWDQPLFQWIFSETCTMLPE